MEKLALDFSVSRVFLRCICKEADIIHVRRAAEYGSPAFEVVVREGNSETLHHVTMSREIFGAQSLSLNGCIKHGMITARDEHKVVRLTGETCHEFREQQAYALRAPRWRLFDCCGS